MKEATIDFHPQSYLRHEQNLHPYFLNNVNTGEKIDRAKAFIPESFLFIQPH